MMKKLLYILSLVVLAMSCTQEIIEPQVKPVESDKVRIGFNVTLPDPTPATRAMANHPAGQLKSLHLAIFDETGYLVEYVQANPVLAEVNDIRYNYTANISLSKERRIVHFIGNGPSEVKFGNEAKVTSSIKSSGNEDLYWYRKELDAIAGVAPTFDDEPYQPTPETLAQLTEIPLIRNFVKIVLENEAANFTLKSYGVVNTLKSGMLAAYDSKTSQFIDYFTYKEGEVTIDYDDPTIDATIPADIVDAPKTFDALRNEGYDGNIPAVAEYTSLNEAMTNAVGEGMPYFVYERETPISSPSYIIAYGTYEGKDQYYKIDLRDADGNYFPMLRNFEYTITLKTVSRGGYDSPEEAAKSTGSGDISTALETISLVYISDGTASLEVEYTEKVITTEEPVALSYEFLSNVSAGTYGSVSSMHIIVNNDYGATGAAISKINGSAVTFGEEVSLSSNPGAITITPTTPTSSPKTQTVTIFAEYQKDGHSKILQRTVKYIVMTKRTMEVVCIPSEVPKTRGTEFDLEITIPGGLSSSMFPLELAIEAEALSITPDNSKDHMPVQSGKSVSGSGKSAFYFIKTLEWADYDPLQPETTIVCHFKTNKDISATKIYVANPYFETANTTLGNYDPNYFTGLKYNGGASSIMAGEGRDVIFTFNFPKMVSVNGVLQPIEVKLTNLEPDEESYAGELVFKGVEDGSAVYEYQPKNTGEQTLHLLTSHHTQNVRVDLASYQYISAYAECSRDVPHFSDVSLTSALVGEGNTVTFTFSYDESANDTGAPVTLTLTNLKPQAGDSRFTDLDNGVYRFQPDQSTANSLKQEIVLVAQDFGSRTTVEISSEDYGTLDSDYVETFRSLVIAHGSHTQTANAISDSNNGAYVRVYDSNPEGNWSDGLVQCRMNSTGLIYYEDEWKDTIKLNHDIVEDTKFYLQYYTTEYRWGFFPVNTYYVATVTAETLVKGGEITWVEQ